MHTTIRASLVTFCIGLLLVIGACSGGGSPVTANPGSDLSKYAAGIEGVIYQNSTPAASGRVFVYDLDTQKVFYEAVIGSDGKYTAGADPGQYLVFPVSPTGWRAPILETDFSNYVNVESGMHYRMDVELTDSLPAGEKLVFGFVTSIDNDKPVVGAVVTASGRSTTSDGYGFYALAVPAGTSDFTITASGFFNLNENTRDAQAAGDYFDTPFFKLHPVSPIGSSIGGVVRDISDATGLGGVRITLTRPEDPNNIAVKFLTNLGGEYRFFNLPEGIYKLYFERPGYVSGYREGLVIKGEDKVMINMWMQRDDNNRGTLSGHVNSTIPPLYAGVGGARVTAANPLLGSYVATTQSTGLYKIEKMLPGNYSISVIAPSSGGSTFYEAVNTFQTIFAGDNTLDFSLRFIDEGVLRGTVTIGGGGGGLIAYPPTGVEVTAEKVGGVFTGVKWRTNTDGKGQFTYNGIPAGLYLVQASVDFGLDGLYSGAQANVVVNSGETSNISLEIAK